MDRSTVHLRAATAALNRFIIPLSLLSFAHGAQAQLRAPDSVDLPEGATGSIVVQGEGYQLAEVDLSSMSDLDVLSDETDLPVQAPSGVRRTWAFSSLEGIQSAPISELLRADLMEEVGSSAFAADGAEFGMWLVDEAAAGQALSADSEITPEPIEGPDPVEGPQGPPDEESFGLCSKKKKQASKQRVIDLTPATYRQPLSIGAFNGNLNVNSNQRGQVSITVHYTKKSRCGITYGVNIERVEVAGNVDLTGTELTLSGTVFRFDNVTRFNILNIQRTFSFLVGPIVVVIQPGIRADAALQVKAEVDASVGVRTPVNGRYSFAYSCTTKSCDEVRPPESFIEAAPDPVQPIGSVSARVVVKPSLNIAAQTAVYLYVKTFTVARAEVGVNVGVPAELWAYHGNTCGDADGDGSNETVDAATLDLNADLYAYAELNGKTRSIDLKLGAPWEKLAFDSSAMTSARERDTYRRNVYFQDLLSGGSTALSPLLVSAPSVPLQGSQLTLRARPCVPFLGGNLDYVVDFGGEGTQTITGSKAGVSVPRDWASPGAKTLIGTIVRDSLRREIHGRSSQRVINVDAGATTPPEQPAPVGCAFNGQTVPHGESVTAYLSKTTQVCEPCESQQRVCDNGVLSGSYLQPRCTPRQLGPHQQCP